MAPRVQVVEKFRVVNTLSRIDFRFTDVPLLLLPFVLKVPQNGFSDQVTTSVSGTRSSITLAHLQPLQPPAAEDTMN